MEKLQSEASRPIDSINTLKEFVVLYIRKWISGEELMERWKVKPLDLVDLVLRKKLHVFEPDGRLFDCKYEEEIRINHPSPFPPSPPVENPTVYDLIFDAEAYDFKIPHGYIPPDYIPLANKIEHCMFRLIEVERFEKDNNLELLSRAEIKHENNDSPNEPNTITESEHADHPLSAEMKKERKKTEVQIIRERVREKAAEIWRDDPTITIADMFVSDEISKIAVRKNGEIFAEKTIRNWINDLCPDRSPGRRPEKQPKESDKGTKGLPCPDPSP
jgi:hypothetical protein